MMCGLQNAGVKLASPLRIRADHQERADMLFESLLQFKGASPRPRRDVKQSTLQC
jgi:hypothetical protein